MNSLLSVVLMLQLFGGGGGEGSSSKTSPYLRYFLKQLGLLNMKYHLINSYCLKQQGVLFLLPESQEKLNLRPFQCCWHLKLKCI